MILSPAFSSSKTHKSALDPDKRHQTLHDARKSKPWAVHDDDEDDLDSDDGETAPDSCSKDDPTCRIAPQRRRGTHDDDNHDDDGDMDLEDEEEEDERAHSRRGRIIKKPRDVQDVTSDVDSLPDTLAFFLQSKEAERIRRVSVGRLDFLLNERAVDTVILGYLRAHLAAEEIAQRIDWVAAADAIGSGGDDEGGVRGHQASRTQYENPLFLASASPYSPYFALNYPLLAFLNAEVHGNAPTGGNNPDQGIHPAEVRQRRLQQRARQQELDRKPSSTKESLETLGLSATALPAWKEVIRDRAGANYKPTSHDPFSTSVIHNAAAVGYYKDGLLARNLFALGLPSQSVARQELWKKKSSDEAPAPKAEILLVEYDAFLTLIYELQDDMHYRVETAVATALVNTKRGRTTAKSPPSTQADDDSASASSSSSLEACVCGPHVGLARHLVAFVSAGSKAPHVAVYVEPIIVSAASGADISHLAHPTELLRPPPKEGERRPRKEPSLRRQFRWKPRTNLTATATAASDEALDTYDRYLLADTWLTARLQDLNGSYLLPFEPDIRVDYLLVQENPEAAATPKSGDAALASASNDRRRRSKGVPSMINQGGRRSLQQIKGQEALCIQYCQYMAYALRDQMKNETIPSEQLVLPLSDQTQGSENAKPKRP